MRSNLEIVYSALMQGHEIKIGSYVFVCCEDKKIYIKGTKISDGVESSILLNADFSMNDFIEMCNELTDQEMAIIVMNTSLNRSL